MRMATYYGVIRSGSLNLSGSWRTQAEAVAALRAALEAGQADIVADSALVKMGRGDWETVAEGQSLVALVEQWGDQGAHKPIRTRGRAA